MKNVFLKTCSLSEIDSDYIVYDDPLTVTGGYRSKVIEGNYSTVTGSEWLIMRA